MTRRERLERRIERRREWADKAKQASASAYDRAHTIFERIPPGQPILVGHYSEKGHRADLKRIDNAMAASFERSKMAETHVSKAGNLESFLDRAIFSDDSDATQALEERITQNETKRAHMKEINRLYRAGDAASLAGYGFDLEALKAKLSTAYSWCQQPYPGYELQNLGQRIQTDKKRLEAIKQQQQRATAAGNLASGVFLENCEQGYCRITFAEKPAREVLNALKAAGYWWAKGSWAGKLEQLPAEVKALLEVQP